MAGWIATLPTLPCARSLERRAKELLIGLDQPSQLLCRVRSQEGKQPTSPAQKRIGKMIKAVFVAQTANGGMAAHERQSLRPFVAEPKPISRRPARRVLCLAAIFAFEAWGS